jgi:hypothetical protein
MSRIDVSTHSFTQGAGAGRSEAPSAAGAVAVRIDRTSRPAERSRIEGRRRARQVRGLASASQIAEKDFADLRERPRDELIARLSRILLIAERDAGPGGGDEIDGIFLSMLNEHLRRLMLMRKPESAEPQGVASWR